jgi:hypothetical protein
VSELELLGYVVPAVHAQVESQQTPQVLPLRARSVQLMTLREAKSAPPAPAGSDELKLKVAVEGGYGAAFYDQVGGGLQPHPRQYRFKRGR